MFGWLIYMEMWGGTSPPTPHMVVVLLFKQESTNEVKSAYAHTYGVGVLLSGITMRTSVLKFWVIVKIAALRTAMLLPRMWTYTAYNVAILVVAEPVQARSYLCKVQALLLPGGCKSYREL
jgi:hypothetical protein